MAKKSRKIKMPYGAVEVESRPPRSRLSLSIAKEHGDMMPSVKIGQRHRMVVDGKVISLRSDEYGHSVDMDVQPKGIMHEIRQEVPSSLTRAMKQRRRDRAGRFE